MYTTIHPIFDTTIYEKYPNINTGIDSLLELKKQISGDSKYVSRILMQFNTNDIQEKLQSLNIINPEYYLKLYINSEEEISNSYSLECRPIYENWTSGLGRYYNIPSTQEGANWVNSSTNVEWGAVGAYYTSSYNSHVGGGNWYITPNIICTQSFNYDEIHDTKINITPIINAYLSGSIFNHGIMIKIATNQEYDNNSFGTLKFYSLESNTIYQPILEIISNTYEYITGSNEYYTEEVISSQVQINTSESLATPFTNTNHYLELYDVVNINSSSKQTSTIVTPGVVQSTIIAPGSDLTGSLSGMSLAGNINCKYNGVIDIQNYIGNITNSTFTGIISNPTNTFYSGLITSQEINGSIKGVINGTLSGSFSLSSMSGSYTGIMDIISSSNLTHITQSYSITVPIMGYTCDTTSSQDYYITGSNILYPVNDLSQTVVSIKGLKSQYSNNDIVKMRLHVRDQYPALRYTTGSAYLYETFYLPTGSMYAIKDVISEQYIIDFQNPATLLNCDITGSYFILDCNSLYPERYYSVEIKSQLNNQIKYFTDYKFKIIE